VGSRPWPNAFIVGAPKAATTSLHRYLGQHPAIYMSPVKEPFFFDHPEWNDPDATEDYLSLFADAGDEAIRGEATPHYLMHPEVPDRIVDRIGRDVHIVASLRDPLQRAYSQYWERVAGNKEEQPFVDAIREDLDRDPVDQVYIQRGTYAEPLRRYVDTFGEDRVHVLLVDDLKADAHAAVAEICSFLGVDEDPVDDIDLTRKHHTYEGVPYNDLIETIRTDERVKAIAQRLLPQSVRDWLGNDVLLADEPKPPMSDEARELLVDVHAPDIAELEELLDRELPELRASWKPDD
jgi:hypothetical protein